MIRKLRFRGEDVAADIRNKYDYDGDLADIYASTKGQLVHKWHHYIPLYDRYFSRYRGTSVKFLEIGVSRGGSLQMWRRYLGDDAIIFGIDIAEKCREFDGLYGNVRIGSQTDGAFLKSVVDEMGGVDVVLDDGSHQMTHIATSLRVLYPRLSLGGTYLIEDLHTAYREKFGGGYDARANFFNEIRGIMDDLHRPYHDRGAQIPELDGSVTGIHIHDSIAVIEKGPVHPPVHSKVY